jgi:hypothetical protein
MHMHSIAFWLELFNRHTCPRIWIPFWDFTGPVPSDFPVKSPTKWENQNFTPRTKSGRNWS